MGLEDMWLKGPVDTEPSRRLIVMPACVRFALHPLDFHSWDLHTEKSQTISVT